MKTSSSKIVRESDPEFEIKSYPLHELKFGEDRLQHLVDSLHEKKKALRVEQDTRSVGFRVDSNIEDSYPKAREDVEKFEARVKEEVEKRLVLIENRAYEDGFQKAKNEGYQAGLKKVREEAGLFVDEIAEMAVNFKKIREEMVIKNERAIINMIIMIVSKIILSEYRAKTGILKDMISSLIKMTGEREDVELRMNQYDYERVSQFAKTLVEELSLKNGIRLEIDRTIDKGGVKLITNFGMIDATLDQQFSILKRDLLARVPEPRSNLVEERKIEKSTPGRENGEIRGESAEKLPKQRMDSVKSSDVAKLVKDRIKKDE